MRARGIVTTLVICLTWLAGCSTSSAPQVTASQVAGMTMAQPGDTVKQKTMALTGRSIDDAAPANAAAQPAAGTRWVALDIDLQNLGTQPHHYDATLHRLTRTIDNYEYRALKHGVVQPALTPVEVPASGSQRG